LDGKKGQESHDFLENTVEILIFPKYRKAVEEAVDKEAMLYIK
jgi:hypothetical protein